MVWETFLYEIRGKFAPVFHPRRGEQTLCHLGTREEAVAEMEQMKREGNYSLLKLVRVEIPIENGHNCGRGRETVEVTWKGARNLERRKD